MMRTRKVVVTVDVIGMLLLISAAAVFGWDAARGRWVDMVFLPIAVFVAVDRIRGIS